MLRLGLGVGSELGLACAAAAACRRAGAPPPPPPAQQLYSRDAPARPRPAPRPPGEIRVRIRVRVTPPPTPPPPGLREESLDGLSDGRTWQVVMAGRLADHSYPLPPVAYPPPPGAYNAAAPAHAHAHAPCAAAARAAATRCMPRRLCRKQAGSAFGQLALRRLHSAPEHACLRLPQSSGQPRPISRLGRQSGLSSEWCRPTYY